MSVRPYLNTELKSLLSGNKAASAGGTAVSTEDYLGFALIINNPGATTSTDSGESPTAIVSIQTTTAVDTAWATPTTLHTFDTADTAGGTVQAYEMPLKSSKGKVRAYVTIADGASSSCPCSVTGLFPDRGW